MVAVVGNGFDKITADFLMHIFFLEIKGPNERGRILVIIDANLP
jgi:hypothetical protein